MTLKSLTRRSLILSAPAMWAADKANASDLTIELPGAKKLRVSELRGKCAAIEIFKTTCPHCQQSMPIVERVYKQFAAKGFQPIGVAVDQYPAALVAEFVKRYGISFPVGWAPTEEIAKFLEVELMQLYVPAVKIFDKRGQVHATYRGGDSYFSLEEANLRNTVELLTKAPARKRV